MMVERDARTPEGLALDMVTRIRQEWRIDKVSTHYNGCWLYHGECAVRLLVAEIDRLRAELAAMVERGGDLARHGCPRCTGVDMPVPALCCVRCGSRWFTDD